MHAFYWLINCGRDFSFYMSIEACSFVFQVLSSDVSHHWKIPKSAKLQDFDFVVIAEQNGFVNMVQLNNVVLLKPCMFRPTFLRAHKGFLPSVQPLVRLQLTTLDKRLPTVWVVTQIRSLSLRGKKDTFQQTVLPLFYNYVIITHALLPDLHSAVASELTSISNMPKHSDISYQGLPPLPVCVLLWAWRDFSLGNTRLQMLQRIRLDEVSPSLMSSRTVSARGRPLRIPSWQQEYIIFTLYLMEHHKYLFSCFIDAR